MSRLTDLPIRMLHVRTSARRSLRPAILRAFRDFALISDTFPFGALKFSDFARSLNQKIKKLVIITKLLITFNLIQRLLKRLKKDTNLACLILKKMTMLYTRCCSLTRTCLAVRTGKFKMDAASFEILLGLVMTGKGE